MNRFWSIICLWLGLIVLAGCAGGSISSKSEATAVSAASCEGLTSGQTIKIEGAWTRATTSDMAGMATPTPGGMAITKSSASYMVIHNCGNQDDALTQAQSDVGKMTTIMMSEIKDGKASMKDVEAIEIPAGKRVELKPGGYHVMLMNLNSDLHPGDPVALTLKFNKAGEIKVTAPVKAP